MQEPIMSKVHYDSHSPYMSFNIDDLKVIVMALDYWFEDNMDGESETLAQMANMRQVGELSDRISFGINEIVKGKKK
jgi:hypothetical protein